jgi:hypothetical protein
MSSPIESVHQVLARIETLVVEESAVHGENVLRAMRLSLSVRFGIAASCRVDDTEDVLLGLAGHLVLLLAARERMRGERP